MHHEAVFTAGAETEALLAAVRHRPGPRARPAPGQEGAGHGVCGQKSSWHGICRQKSSWHGICGEKGTWNGICGQKKSWHGVSGEEESPAPTEQKGTRKVVFADTGPPRNSLLLF